MTYCFDAHRPVKPWFRLGQKETHLPSASLLRVSRLSHCQKDIWKARQLSLVAGTNRAHSQATGLDSIVTTRFVQGIMERQSQTKKVELFQRLSVPLDTRANQPNFLKRGSLVASIYQVSAGGWGSGDMVQRIFERNARLLKASINVIHLGQTFRR
jgi:hypothetical protein